MEAPLAEPAAAVSNNKRERPNDGIAPVPDDLSLPSAAVLRIVKQKLPNGVNVGTDAKRAFAKACSLFVLYVTTLASDVSKEAKRSTVNAQDVLHALRDLEFDELLPEMEVCLAGKKTINFAGPSR